MRPSQTPGMRTAVARALRAGDIALTGKCEACKRAPAQVMHHWSYADADWLDVIPVCRSCHAQIHSGAILEPRTGRRYSKAPRKPDANALPGWTGTRPNDFRIGARWRRCDHRKGRGRLNHLRGVVDGTLCFREWSHRYGGCWAYEVVELSSYAAGLFRPEWHIGFNDWRDVPSRFRPTT